MQLPRAGSTPVQVHPQEQASMLPGCLCTAEQTFCFRGDASLLPCAPHVVATPVHTTLSSSNHPRLDMVRAYLGHGLVYGKALLGSVWTLNRIIYAIVILLMLTIIVIAEVVNSNNNSIFLPIAIVIVLVIIVVIAILVRVCNHPQVARLLLVASTLHQLGNDQPRQFEVHTQAAG